MTLPFVIGAYASHPAPELEGDYYALLAEQPWVSGVEIPYPGQLATDSEVLASHLASRWARRGRTRRRSRLHPRAAR